MSVAEIREAAALVAPAEHVDIIPAPSGPAMVTTAPDLVARLDLIQEVMRTAMRPGVDYGIIPGAKKPSLWKPGAEKLGVVFQLDIQIRVDEERGPGDHLTARAYATVFNALSGSRLGDGEGLCSSRESKYAYRQGERVCPGCAKPAIIKGKAEFGGGWVCFRRKGGCGQKFEDADPAITGQQVGQVDNPELPDTWNTVIKMGRKRARVDAVLNVTGASALFTQDIDEDDASEYASAVSDVTPPADLRQPLAAERVAAIMQRLGALITSANSEEEAAKIGQRISLAYTSAGGTAERINADAITAFSPRQADQFEAALTEATA